MLQSTIQTIPSEENIPRRYLFDSLPENTSVDEFNYVRRLGNSDAIEEENFRKKYENKEKE